MKNVWTKIYSSTGFTASSHLLLGMICLDSSIHTFARIAAGFTITSTHCVFMYLKLRNEKYVYDKHKHDNCNHDYPYDTIDDNCKKCGKLGKGHDK